MTRSSTLLGTPTLEEIRDLIAHERRVVASMNDEQRALLSEARRFATDYAVRCNDMARVVDAARAYYAHTHANLRGDRYAARLAARDALGDALDRLDGPA